MDELDLLLLSCASGTLSKYGKEANIEAISKKIFEILNTVCFGGTYDHVTRDYGLRDKLMEYSPISLASCIDHKIRNSLENDLTVSNEILRGSFWKYAYQYIPKIYNTYYLGNDVYQGEKNANGGVDRSGVRNVEYYPPANSCRDAVLRGTQFKVSESSHKIAGMQAFSSVGKVRKNQEDSYYVGVHPKNSDFKIMIVADGMGGHENGEYASNTLVKNLILWFESLPSSLFYERENWLIQSLESKIREINRLINSKYPGAGSTLCISIQRNDNILLGSIGDSKGVVLENGKKVCETVSQDIPTMMGLPSELGKFHGESNRILHCVGANASDDNLGLVIKKVPIQEGKKYDIFLCSDGVSDCLSTGELPSVIKRAKKNGENVAESVVRHSLENALEFNKEKRRLFFKTIIEGGIFGISEWLKIRELLNEHELELTIGNIRGGKDNATAVYDSVQRKRR